MTKEIRTTKSDTSYEVLPVYTAVEHDCEKGCMACHNPCEFGLEANYTIIKGGGYE